ncbi:MAG: hypothetical protein WBP29_07380 [Candidatus Zixiibacteriota bacterium]
MSLTAAGLDSAYVAQLRHGIAFTIVEQFDSARNVFSDMIARDQSDHAAMLYLAGVDHAEMMDREDYARKDQFEASADAAIKMAERELAAGRDSAWAYLTIGNAHGYEASLEAKAGSWWTAMRRGLKAKGAYLNALKVDSQMYDAYLGLGTYHYWKSAKTEFINWLPFVGDRKNDGISELQLAVDSSLFSNHLALNSLIWIYLERKEPQSASDCAQRLSEKYPQSRLVKWGMAFSSYSAGHFHEAVQYFGDIITSLESDTSQNYFNLIECRFHRGKIFLSVNDSAAAKREFELLVKYPVSGEVRKRQKDKLHEARDELNRMATSSSLVK